MRDECSDSAADRVNLDRVFGSDTEGNLRERSSNEKKKDSGGLSAVAGVLVVLPTTAKA
jgi:hypothetical protein